MGPNFIDDYEASYDGQKLREGEHDGTIMDAARIYISQMTDVDFHFDLPEVGKIKYDSNPCSAITLKADRVRINSRRDIRIIAGNDSQIDSNG